jgi:hypothetical protein
MRFTSHRRMTTLTVVLVCAVPIAGMAQPSATFDLTSKLRFHAESVYSPWPVAGSAAYAGLLQKIGTPEEWGKVAEPTASASPLLSAAPASMRFSLLVSIRRYTRTLGIFDLAEQDSGGERPTRSKERS